ncbi:hypothetical protein ECANGB1_663 [Enterospora canceri]|uniref:Uncharacterized protein n=1 Tax=Enterospora canceri TaxID=1081671 RepID=A0A1Y1S489_9MICR|nr:hypothetical protein ECANGB1_663 [Enterospora canceri]
MGKQELNDSSIGAIQDSGDNSMDMEEYMARADAELAQMKTKCKRMKIPAEPQQYSVSPLQNMKQRLQENYSEIDTGVEDDKIYYRPHKRVDLSGSVKRNMMITVGITCGLGLVTSVAYLATRR